MINKYLLLYPNTFLWCLDDSGLLYNTKKGSSYYFRFNDSIQNLCKELIKPENLYKCVIHDLNDDILNKWLDKILKLEMGEILQLSDEYSPISFPPLINLQSDVLRLESTLGRNIGENILSYLTDINIYLGGICETNDFYYKQFLYPISSEEIMNPLMLKDNLLILRRFPIRLNIVGGDLINYPFYNELFQLVNNSSFTIVFYVFDYLFVSLYRLLFNENGISFKIICTNYNFYLSISDFIKEETNRRGGNNIIYSWLFFVLNDEDILRLDTILTDEHSIRYEVYPVYIECNESFFQKNVYITKSYLSKPKVSKKYIFRNSVINSNFWGKITIMSDGKIYSNLNQPSIGNLHDTIYEILIRELKMKNAWRFLREDCMPCKKCLYKYICPPISNCELMLKRYNMCSIIRE